MIEGRPRESLVQYENPIEVFSFLYFNLLFRSQPDKTLKIPSKRLLDVSELPQYLN